MARRKYRTKSYKVVLLKMEHKSFQWGNGYYIVLERDREEKIFRLCFLHEGKPERFEDGKFMTTCTGLKNKGVIKTNLIYRDKIPVEL